MVIVDDCTARILLAEGALCYDLDTGQVTREGSVVVMPTPGGIPDRPILVCGSSPEDVRTTAEALENQGLPAWQVRAATPPGARNQEGATRAGCPGP